MSMFETGIIPVNAFKVKMGKPITKGRKKAAVEHIELDGRKMYPTDRFWKSMQMRFRFRKTIFKYFTPDEVFSRITEVDNGMVRYCVENSGDTPKLLAMTNPAKPIIQYDNLEDILRKPESNLVPGSVNYTNGVIQTAHNTSVPWKINIAGDDFVTRFHVDTPIDGFGKPAIYVSLLREVCVNGMVGYAPAFRTELNLGKKDEGVTFTLERALENYSNEEMYNALIQRIESSTTSFCSVYEAMKFHKTLVKIYNEGNTNYKKLVISREAGTSERDIGVFNKFYETVGDLNSMYGVANIDSISPKKQKLFPTKARLYSLLNLATEIATHDCKPAGARKMQGFVGQLLSDEFDMEGTADDPNISWQDLFMKNRETQEALQSSNASVMDFDFN